MIIYSIYKLVNRINGKVYIGFTKNIKRRLSEHKSAKDNTRLHNAINKYGFDNFTFEIICQTKDGHYCKNILENHFINMFDSFNNGYNLTLGGEGIIGFKHSEMSKNKMSKPKTDSHKQKLKISRNKRIDKPMLGKKHSFEARKQMSLSKKGKPIDKNKKTLKSPDGIFKSVTDAGIFYGHNVYYMSRKIKNNPDKFQFI